MGELQGHGKGALKAGQEYASSTYESASDAANSMYRDARDGVPRVWSERRLIQLCYIEQVSRLSRPTCFLLGNSNAI